MENKRYLDKRTFKELEVGQMFYCKELIERKDLDHGIVSEVYMKIARMHVFCGDFSYPSICVYSDDSSKMGKISFFDDELPIKELSWQLRVH